MTDKKEPKSVKIIPASKVSDSQIASGEVGSAYSNAEVQLRKRSVDPDHSGASQSIEPENPVQRDCLSEAEALEADIEAEEAAMSEAEKKAKKRRIQRMLARDLGIPFKDLDGIV